MEKDSNANEYFAELTECTREWNWEDREAEIDNYDECDLYGAVESGNIEDVVNAVEDMLELEC